MSGVAQSRCADFSNRIRFQDVPLPLPSVRDAVRSSTHAAVKVSLTLPLVIDRKFALAAQARKLAGTATELLCLQARPHSASVFLFPIRVACLFENCVRRNFRVGGKASAIPKCAGSIKILQKRTVFGESPANFRIYPNRGIGRLPPARFTTLRSMRQVYGRKAAARLGLQRPSQR